MNGVYEIGQKLVGNVLSVTFSDGSVKWYDAIELGCAWFRMSNDAFYETYGFNFNPHRWGLYDYCRKMVYKNESTLDI